jgi:tetratricopeptide (TPR) repeat protein|nr:tetratricopeptide repeat protein [Kofleriaceae bacterium]
MADLPALLAVLEHDPDDAQALEALTAAARQTPPDVRASRFASARKTLAERGRPDGVVQLIDIELATTGDLDRKVDLLLEKGMVLDGELLDVPAARDAFSEVLRLRADDTMAKEAIADLDVAAQNWQKFAAKFIHEATASTDRSLAAGMYASAAEAYVRFAPDAPEAEAHLRKALEVDPRNAKAAFHLARLLRGASRWQELAALFDSRGEAGALEERVSALLHLATIARGKLNDVARATAATRKALALDPAQPQALRAVTDAAANAGDWATVVAAYQAAVKAKPTDDLGMLLQIAMAAWKHTRQLELAEEYFRRVRKIEPAHPAALDFYREYYPARGENNKLLALLKSVDQISAPASGAVGEAVPQAAASAAPSASMPAARSGRSRPLSQEIAELSEAQANPEKAIEAWKQTLRQDPTSQEARAALARLYRRTEKWNALLDLMKDETERLPADDIAGRVAKLFDVIDIYRDRLRLDVMVINTYNAILKLDPDNRRATDELASKYRALGRWNDVITLLSRKADAANVPDDERVALLREVADLWAERFGNFANAIKPLERILELVGADPDAVARLKDIYTRRRQWRALIDVLAREANALPLDERRAKQSEMGRLAAERLGDTRLAIEVYNSVLAEAGTTPVPDTLAALSALYEREKRYLALAEILHRQVESLLSSPDGLARGKEAVGLLEKLGQIYADRVHAPQAAAQAWQHILEIEPNHAKALRTLRELYATAGDFAGLEKLYARLGQEDELVEALLAIADRIDAKAARLPIVERAAQLAQKRADAAPEGGNPQTLEKARQVWERVLAVDAAHVGAAAALAPIYAKQEKWARLIAVLEIELAAAADVPARLAKIGQIRQLCEQRLSSRNLAFVWTVRAFDLDPESEPLFGELLRLADGPDQWREVAACFERNHAGAGISKPTRLRLVRELARVASRRLGDLEKARAYHRRVLELEPADRDAESQLEDLAMQLADWPELLASYRRRAAREADPTARAALLVDIAALQEEKLVDLDGAAAAYHEALEALPGNLRALRAVARIEEARGDWESLANVLVAELAQTPEAGRFELVMRLGKLEEQQIERPGKALGYYQDALGVVGANHKPQPAAIAAVARFLAAGGPGDKLESAARVAAARLVLPHLEAGALIADQARALEVIRADAGIDPGERIELDRALMRLYHTDLGDPAAAWQAGLRVLGAEPADRDVRGALGALAGQLGRDGEWARELAAALAKLRDVKPGERAPDNEVRLLATELAHVLGDRLQDRAGAERAWLVVLGVEADADDAFDALAATYRLESRFTDLRALLERRAEVTLEQTTKRDVLLDLATLEEDVLSEAANAAAAHRRVLELDPAYLASYAALDRLYASTQKWPELEDLLARQADHVTPAQQLALAYRRAELFAHHLGDITRAIDLLDDVLGKQRGHADGRELLEELLASAATPELTMRVARLLEPLYEQDRLWKDLVHVLRAQRALVTGGEAVELLGRIAELEETELAGAGHAFDAWVEVLGLDPAHERARVELSRLAPWLSRWPDATAALERAAAAVPAHDVATRAALLGDLATYYDVQAGDAARAIDAYQRLIAADPTNPATVRRAGASLARLYEEAKQWPLLRDITRRQADWAEAAGERRALLARVAALEEDKLADRAAAIATWRDVLADQPADAGALHALERLYQAAEKWRELVDVLRRKLETASAGDATALLARIAEVHEIMLEEPHEAIAAYLELIDRDDRDGRALGELARLYRQAGRHADLLDVLERQIAVPPADAAAAAQRLAQHVEVAQLLAGPIGRPIEALDRWAGVLRAEPRGPFAAQALSALERALDDVDHRAMAAQLLQPFYEGAREHEKLAQLHARVADWSDEPAAKLRALGEVVRLREHALGDVAGAFAAQLAALRVAATEPELAQTVADTERLAGELEREGDLIDAYRDVAPNVLDADIQRRLYLDVADLARAVRKDHALAREYYQKVLDAVPDDRRALAALESIYRDTGDDERLVEILVRQAELAGSDVDHRVHALVEAAQLYVTLKRAHDAIATWEQVIAIAPERRDAVEALEPLYREQGRWPDVVDLYERRLGFATTIEEAVALRVQLGEIHERELRDVEAAIDNFSAALSGDPKHAGALAALERYLADPDVRALAAEVLEPIYVGQHRWLDLIRVYEAKLAGATEPPQRLKLTRFVARLYEEQLEDFEHASHWYAKVFRENPADPAIRDQLNRLASIVDNWAFVAQTYQGYLDDESGESPELREVAIAAATIYDRRLGDVQHAYDAYRRALSIDADDAIPDERELVRRLEELLARAQRWQELIAVYDDVVGRTDDELRRDALIKRARLFEDGLEDTARAVDAWREVVLATEMGGAPKVDFAYREAVGELERLYRARTQWHDLVELFEARLGRASAPSEIAELRLRLAELVETQMADLAAAIDQYELVVSERVGAERAVAALERLVVHEQHRERIAAILEPVYREQDWWQKLVVILDAKLAYVHDPGDQVRTLHEIADIHEQRGGALDLALHALARAWRIDVTDDESLTKLLSLAGKLDAWDEAVAALEDGAPHAPNGELAAGLWGRAAEIHEAQRGDNARAIIAWRKVEEARGDDVIALAALDRLLAVEGRVAELVVVVERRADLADDAGVRLVLLHRVAALYEEVLVDKPKAIAAYKNVLGVDDTDLTALDALERLYRSSDGGGDARELAATIERKIELTADVVTRKQLRHAAAEVYERELADIYQAISQLVAVLDDDAGEAQALAELDRIYHKEKMWPELLDVVDRRALLAVSAKDRADLAYRAAHLVESELRDADAAVPRYGAVLQVLPSHGPARGALEQLLATGDDHVETAAAILERVYRGDRDAAGLVRVYERRLALRDRDPAARRADWGALADVHELIAGKPGDAFATWARALSSDPEDLELLAPLQRLADGERLHARLAEELSHLLARSLAPEVEQAFAMRLGQLAEDRLDDLPRAASAYDRASQGPEPRTALAALERVLARSSKWPELAAVLRRQADAAEDDAQTAEYLYREGDLQETTLRDARAAVVAYREVLLLVPAHPRTRSALERLLVTGDGPATGGGSIDPALRRDIVDILEPLFEQDADASRLANVLEARLTLVDDVVDRGQLLARVAELAEHQLGDRKRALDAVLRWLAADPSSHQALGEVDRLADRLGQWPETAARVREVVGSPAALAQPGDVRVALQVFLGRVLRERLGALDDAAAAYRAALAIEPDALVALDPLVDILRQRGDLKALAEALRHRGKVVSDVVERRAAYAEVAQLCERAGDTAGTIAAWREITDNDSSDREALDELARVYRGAGAGGKYTSELVETLGAAARLGASASDEKPLRVEIARLEGESPRAVAAWQAVVDLDGDDLDALRALEHAHARASDWMAVNDIQMRRLDLAKTSADKVAIHAEMARLAESRRQSPDDAIASWYAALDLDNAYQPAYAELERLLAAAGRWHDLVELLERHAELYATLGDGVAEIRMLARAADVWEAQLDSPDAAGEILEKILAREPGSIAALTRLSKIYERSGDWAKCKATLEQALAALGAAQGAAPSGSVARGGNAAGPDAADLFFRLGEVARAGDGDDATAIQHYQRALKHDASHAASIAALEKLARDRRDTALLADMLQRRVATVHATAERVALLVEIAELERKAGRAEAAMAALARAVGDAPDDVRVLGPLADMYFASGRLDEAAPIYDKLASEAKSARRMKDVARFRQRQGSILEARGDRPGALAAYEEALRVNPTDIATMTGLGRMYFEAKDWEKARKIYQSLVLQNIDSDAGVSKGEVYWALGKIHLELGQAPKAKSMFQRGLEVEPGNAALREALQSLQ